MKNAEKNGVRTATIKNLLGAKTRDWTYRFTASSRHGLCIALSSQLTTTVTTTGNYDVHSLASTRTVLA
jgi:hypothetical protein